MALAFSGLLGALFALSGVRRRVIRLNFERIRLAPPPFFRWRLGFRLARDLTALLPPGRLPLPRLHPRSHKALKALRGGPSLLLTAHFGNWEAQAAAWVRQGVPLLGAARPLKGAIPQNLLSRIRKRHAIAVVSRAVPRAALRHLRSGGCFGLLWDQHAPDSVRPGRFFGVPVALNPLPFFLLARDPCPVHFGVLLPDGTLRLIPLLDPSRLRGAGWEDRLARRYHRVLETLVRRHPAHWHGILHARFKTVESYPGHRGMKNVE
jgi:lauroyl/myristoyl acyltransferase